MCVLCLSCINFHAPTWILGICSMHVEEDLIRFGLLGSVWICAETCMGHLQVCLNKAAEGVM